MVGENFSEKILINQELKDQEGVRGGHMVIFGVLKRLCGWGNYVTSGR